jgi:hypothetical protein
MLLWTRFLHPPSEGFGDFFCIHRWVRFCIQRWARFLYPSSEAFGGFFCIRRRGTPSISCLDPGLFSGAFGHFNVVAKTFPLVGWRRGIAGLEDRKPRQPELCRCAPVFAMQLAALVGALRKAQRFGIENSFKLSILSGRRNQPV